MLRGSPRCADARRYKEAIRGGSPRGSAGEEIKKNRARALGARRLRAPRGAKRPRCLARRLAVPGRSTRSWNATSSGAAAQAGAPLRQPRRLASTLHRVPVACPSLGHHPSAHMPIAVPCYRNAAVTRKMACVSALLYCTLPALPHLRWWKHALLSAFSDSPSAPRAPRRPWAAGAGAFRTRFGNCAMLVRFRLRPNPLRTSRPLWLLISPRWLQYNTVQYSTARSASFLYAASLIPYPWYSTPLPDPPCPCCVLPCRGYGTKGTSTVRAQWAVARIAIFAHNQISRSRFHSHCLCFPCTAKIMTLYSPHPACTVRSLKLKMSALPIPNKLILHTSYSTSPTPHALQYTTVVSTVLTELLYSTVMLALYI